MFKDILLALPSWPRAASRPSVRRAVELARVLDAHLTGAVIQARTSIPITTQPYAAGMEKLLRERMQEATDTAQAELAVFGEEANRAGISHEALIVKIPDGGEASDPIVDHAILRNLTVVPFVDNEASADLLQALIFGSGRPVLLLPESNEESLKLDRIVVAWDGGRSAARAVGDALPLLQRASEVVVVTVNRDKSMPQNTNGAALAIHLERNGVKVTLKEVDKGNRSIGEALDEETREADLVVMGAFGHSRLRDFFLGGATKHFLKKPQRPTLLSH